MSQTLTLRLKTSSIADSSYQQTQEQETKSLQQLTSDRVDKWPSLSFLLCPEPL